MIYSRKLHSQILYFPTILACDTNSKQYILRHAQTLTEKANEMKEKICLASGDLFLYLYYIIDIHL